MYDVRAIRARGVANSLAFEDHAKGPPPSALVSYKYIVHWPRSFISHPARFNVDRIIDYFCVTNCAFDNKLT